MLAPLAKQIFTVRPDHPRALDAAKLSAVFASAGIPAVPCESVEAAVQAVLDTGNNVIGLGSLYYYCAFRSAVCNLI